jgi:hypothetical protein
MPKVVAIFQPTLVAQQTLEVWATLCLSLLKQPPIDVLINYALSIAVGFRNSNNRQEITCLFCNEVII